MRYNGKLYEGEFQVSNLGGIRSVDRYITCHGKYGDYKQFVKGHTISTFIASQYQRAKINRNNKTKHVLIHRAVLESFVPNPDPKIYTDVNHKDENKLNNRLNNLEWCTHSDNLRFYNKNHPKEKQAKQNICIICGNRTYNTKYCSNKCLSISNRKSVFQNRDELKQAIRVTSLVEIAKDFGVSDATIRRRCKEYGLPYKKSEIKKYTDEEWSLIQRQSFTAICITVYMGCQDSHAAPTLSALPVTCYLNWQGFVMS